MTNFFPNRARRWVLGPALLVLVIAGAGGLAWQHAPPAHAIPGPSYRVYQGNATVKVRNGNAFATYPVMSCAVVELDPNRNIVDAFVFGLNTNGIEEVLPPELLYYLCAYLGCTLGCQEPGLVVDMLGESESEFLPPGTFWVDTLIDETYAGTGWKTSPVKNTSTQWTFTLKKPEPEAASVVLNDNFRPMQANTTLIAKFVRNKEGFYFKIAGTAPLNDNGTPKVSVEIESSIQGMDSPPDDFATFDNDPINNGSGRVLTTLYSEPVTVDETFIELTCSLTSIPFTVTGQGTSQIVVTPDIPLPPGQCELSIPYDAVSDVDTVDPPDSAVSSVDYPFWVANTIQPPAPN